MPIALLVPEMRQGAEYICIQFRPVSAEVQGALSRWFISLRHLFVRWPIVRRDFYATFDLGGDGPHSMRRAAKTSSTIASVLHPAAMFHLELRGPRMVLHILLSVAGYYNAP